METLLFIIYINDITFSSNIFKFTLYADDTTLFTTIKSPDENNSHSQLINNELSNVTNCRKSASWPTFLGRVASLRRALYIECVDSFNLYRYYNCQACKLGSSHK